MNITRRTFLKSTSAVVLGFPAIVRATNLNSNLQIVAVGCSGKGLSDILETGSHPKAKFVAFCDVDTTHFTKADEKYPNTPHYQDFRDMFAKLGDGFDAATVSTPDHMHASIALDAMRRGKHVYCQKPLSHNVWETRQMRLQAAKSGVTTQMGNQIHSATEYRTAVKLVRSGVIGKIKAVHSWQRNPGNGFTQLTAPRPAGPVPESLNWDWWLGVAPQREYVPGIYHPFKWRDWQDFGNGTMGDFGCHILDPVFTALELTAPETIRAQNVGFNAQTWPSAETIHYLFPGTAWTAHKTLPVTWYDGGRLPDVALAQMPSTETLPGSGSLFIGEGGTMVLGHVAMPRLFPVEQFASFEIPKELGTSHYHAWVTAALGGPKTTDGFDYAGPLTETVLLGNVATRVPNITLEWDAADLRIKNSAEADHLLRTKNRAGWKIPAVA
ncbi:MAG TPA: Gfo/Idh/MocA family oxidoreductase [Chthoniobacter sp.]|jgi:predicted dehydrogenase